MYFLAKQNSAKVGCWYAEYVASGLNVSWNGQMVEPKTHRRSQPPPNLSLH